MKNRKLKYRGDVVFRVHSSQKSPIRLIKQNGEITPIPFTEKGMFKLRKIQFIFYGRTKEEIYKQVKVMEKINNLTALKRNIEVLISAG